MYAHDLKHSVLQYPYTDAWLLHPVSHGWNIPKISLPEYIDVDQLNVYVVLRKQ